MDLNHECWLEAQHGVLGSVLIAPKLASQVISQMTDSDFSGKCVAVFQAIRHIFSQGLPVDVVTIRDKLGADYGSFLVQLMEITPTAAHCQTYIDLAKKQARTAQLRAIGQQMADAEDPVEVQTLLEKAIAVNAENHSLRAVTMFDAVVNFTHRMTSAPPEYLPWPIKGMQKKLNTEQGDFVILGARPSVGKTALALQSAWTMAATKKVGFFSLETGVKKLTDRQIANVCGIPLNEIKHCRLNEHGYQRVMEFANGEAKKRRLEIIQSAGSTVAEVCAYASARQYDVIYIDYLQILSASGKTEYERATEISLSLHRFSQSSGVTVVALSQLSRTGDGGDPGMAALRASGQIEQDADAVLLLYLENEETPNGPRILRCAKNKDGERFRVKLNFDGKHQRFTKYGEDFQAVPNEETPFETIGGIV